MNIPFSPPDLSDLEINEVIATLKSGWITTGPKTKLFEEKIAEYCHIAKAACLNSATAAMELTLRVLGVGEGDEVITSAYTYTASASVIEHVGAKVVLVDTAPDSFLLDYEQLAQAITERTKVIIPVDIAGLMCDYDQIFAVVQSKRHLFNAKNDLQAAFGRVIVMADAAHSFGSSYKKQLSGEVADFSCFSFHAVKNLTCSEGGAVTWRDIAGVDNDALYREFMLLSLHGQSKDAFTKLGKGAWEYDIVYPGYKCNMTDILASLGLAQLRRFPELLMRRKQLINLYDRLLSNSPVKVLKHVGDDYVSNGHLYMVRLIGKDENYRNQVINKMAERGIVTNVHFKPLPLHTAYKKLGWR